MKDSLFFAFKCLGASAVAGLLCLACGFVGDPNIHPLAAGLFVLWLCLGGLGSVLLIITLLKLAFSKRARTELLGSDEKDPS